MGIMARRGGNRECESTLVEATLEATGICVVHYFLAYSTTNVFMFPQKMGPHAYQNPNSL